MSAVDFWKGAGERAGKTFLQVGIATLGISATATYTADSALALPWETALVTAFLSAILSLLTSVLNPSFTAGAQGAAIDASSITSGTLSGISIASPSDGAVVPDTDPSAGLGDVTGEDADQTIQTATQDADTDSASVVPDGEGVATAQS